MFSLCRQLPLPDLLDLLNVWQQDFQKLHEKSRLTAEKISPKSSNSSLLPMQGLFEGGETGLPYNQIKSDSAGRKDTSNVLDTSLKDISTPGNALSGKPKGGERKSEDFQRDKANGKNIEGAHRTRNQAKLSAYAFEGSKVSYVEMRQTVLDFAYELNCANNVMQSYCDFSTHH